MCTDTPQRYLRRILVSDFKQTKCWPIIPSLRRCQCSPPPAYLSMCTDTPQRYLRRILILDFKQKNAGRPFSFQNRFSLLWQPCSMLERLIKSPSFISRATSVDSDCWRLPTTSVLSNKGQLTLQSVLINKSKFLKATHRTKIRKIEISRSLVEALSWRSRRASQHPAVQSSVHP